MVRGTFRFLLIAAVAAATWTLATNPAEAIHPGGCNTCCGAQAACPCQDYAEICPMPVPPSLVIRRSPTGRSCHTTSCTSTVRPIALATRAAVGRSPTSAIAPASCRICSRPTAVSRTAAKTSFTTRFTRSATRGRRPRSRPVEKVRLFRLGAMSTLAWTCPDSSGPEKHAQPTLRSGWAWHPAGKKVHPGNSGRFLPRRAGCAGRIGHAYPPCKR